jgi:type II secretory pathway component GspD/PulD (secretin)
MLSYPLKQSIRLVVCACAIVWTVQGAANAETIETIKSGSPFSMEFRDANIKDVLRALGQAANMNLIVSDQGAYLCP